MANELAEAQKRRIEKLASQLDPSWKIEFRLNRINPHTSAIRFRIRDASGKIRGSVRADFEWEATEIEDKSDAELRGMIAALIRP